MLPHTGQPQGFATKATPVSFYSAQAQAQGSHTPMNPPRPLSAASTHSQNQPPAASSPAGQGAHTPVFSGARAPTPQQQHSGQPPFPAQMAGRQATAPGFSTPVQPMTPSTNQSPAAGMLPGAASHHRASSVASITSAAAQAPTGGVAEELARARAQKLAADQQAAAQTVRAAQAAFKAGTTWMPPGAGIVRLTEYASVTSQSGPFENEESAFRAMVDEFYLPEGFLRLILRNATNGEHRGLEVPNEVLARWYQTCWRSGVRSVQYAFNRAREYTRDAPSSSTGPWYPPPPRMPAGISMPTAFPSAQVTHVVTSEDATLHTTFDNGWQVAMRGTVHCHLAPYARLVMRQQPGQRPTLAYDTKLRFESFVFVVQSNVSFIPRHAIRRVQVEQPIPPEVIAAIKSEGGKKTPKTEEGSEQPRHTITVEKEVLPESPVNEYGITLISMRSLEITESICQLRDLMDMSMHEGNGPLAAMRRFAAQFRELHQQGGIGPPGAQQPPTPGAGAARPAADGGNSGSAQPPAPPDTRPPDSPETGRKPPKRKATGSGADAADDAANGSEHDQHAAGGGARATRSPSVKRQKGGAG